MIKNKEALSSMIRIIHCNAELMQEYEPDNHIVQNVTRSMIDLVKVLLEELDK